MKILLWLLLFLGDWSSALSQLWTLSELLAFAQYLWAFSVAGQEGHTSQRSSVVLQFPSFLKTKCWKETFFAFFIEFDRQTYFSTSLLPSCSLKYTSRLQIAKNVALPTTFRAKQFTVLNSVL